MSFNPLPVEGYPSPTQVRYRDILYHGVNSIVEIRWDSDSPTEPYKVIGFTEKVELNKFIDVITKTYIGMYGEPAFNIPKKAEYFGTVKKFTTDNLSNPGGRGLKGQFTNSLLKYSLTEEEALPNGLIDKFDVIIYSINGEGKRMVTIAFNCTLSSFKRTMNSDSFAMDEFSFKFKKFNQIFI